MKNKPSFNADKDAQLTLSKKNLSHIISLLLIAAFLIFLVGYFLGKRKAIQELCDLNKQDFFSDQIYYAFQRIQDVSIRPEFENPDKAMTFQKEPAKDENITSSETSKSNQYQNGVQYYAQLISFGTLSGAQELVNRLQRNGINTTIIRHKAQVPNSSGKPKLIHWYQVVTDSYCNQEDLKYYIAGIQKIVKLNDVRIVKVDDGCTS